MEFPRLKRHTGRLWYFAKLLAGTAKKSIGGAGLSMSLSRQIVRINQIVHSIVEQKSEARRLFAAPLGAMLLLLAIISTVSFQQLPGRLAWQELEPQSAAGDLDLSFGNGGKVITDFSANDDRATCIAIQSDGKIVVGGTSTDQAGNSDFALARYNTDGSLDPSFGS